MISELLLNLSSTSFPNDQVHLVHHTWSERGRGSNSAVSQASPDGQFLVSGDENGVVWLWEVRPKRQHTCIVATTYGKTARDEGQTSASAFASRCIWSRECK